MTITELVKRFLSNHQAFALFKDKLSTNSYFFHSRVGIALILWVSGGWIHLWTSSSEGKKLTNTELWVPTEPTSNKAMAKLCFTIFHTNARSKQFIMSRVTRKWDTEKVVITYITAVFLDPWWLSHSRSWWKGKKGKENLMTSCGGEMGDKVQMSTMWQCFFKEGKRKQHFVTSDLQHRNDDWITRAVKVAGCWLQCLRTYN